MGELLRMDTFIENKNQKKIEEIREFAQKQQYPYSNIIRAKNKLLDMPKEELLKMITDFDINNLGFDEDIYLVIAAAEIIKYPDKEE